MECESDGGTFTEEGTVLSPSTKYTVKNYEGQLKDTMSSFRDMRGTHSNILRDTVEVTQCVPKGHCERSSHHIDRAGVKS